MAGFADAAWGEQFVATDAPALPADAIDRKA